MSVFDDFLKSIEKYLNKKDAIEVSINEPGCVWVEFAHKGYQRFKEDKVTLSWAQEFCTALSGYHGLAFSRQKPVLACDVPPAGHRFQAIVSKENVRSGIAISIRIKRRIRMKWENYGVTDLDKPLSLYQKGEFYEQHGFKSDYPVSSPNWLTDMIRQGAPVLTCGGTSTGKTTFFNSLVIPNIPMNARVITVQDVHELDPPQENKVELLVPKNADSELTYQEVIDACVRFNPTAIIMSEVSIENAFAVARLLNTGESSFMATLHANNPQEALEAIRRNIDMSGHASKSVVGLLIRSIGAFVQLTNNPEKGRIVSGIESPEHIQWKDLIDEAGTANDIAQAKDALVKISQAWEGNP